MSAHDPIAPARAPGYPLALMLLVASLALVWVLLPFRGAILWGAVLALLFTPWYRRVLPWLGGRRTTSAALTLAALSTVVLFPMLLVAAAVARESSQFYLRVQSGEIVPATFLGALFAALPSGVRELLDRFGLVDFAALQRRADVALVQGSQWLATQAFGIGQNTFEFMAGVGIALYLAFFLIRDGDTLLHTLRRAAPLPPGQMQALGLRFGTVVRATVKGNLLVALVQGALGGLAFWALGVGAPLLWALGMGVLSLLPAVGAALVWLPVAAYFLATGALWQGLALIAWGVLAIGLVDNLLRPILVGRETGLPDWLVMLSTLGGLAVMGIDGFVLGPAVAAMFVAVWQIRLVAQDQPAG